MKQSYNMSKSGFTLIEVLVYIVGLTLLIGAITGFLFYMYGWYRQVTLEPRIDQVAISLISKFEEDIRSSNTISQIQSGVAAGSISLLSTLNSVSTTKNYSVSNGRIMYQENSGQSTFLSPSDIYISGFYLYQMTSPFSTSIRFELDMSYPTNTGTSTNIYHGLSIMRQSYK